MNIQLKQSQIRKQYTAELIPIDVYKNGVLIGSGYFLIREDGLHSEPVICDSRNIALPYDWYQLKPYHHMSYLVVVPEMKQ